MKYTYWLACLPFSSLKKRRLCWDFISAASVYEADKSEFEKKDYLTGMDVDLLCDQKRKKLHLDEFEKLTEKKIGFCPITADNYPSRLKDIFDPPFALFYKGSLPKNEGIKVSVVGARICSSYGQNISQKLGEAFGKLGIDVISGMAKGVDSAAHYGALTSDGKTYAVLGNGPDICYPRQNLALYENIIENGGIISEYAPGTNAQPIFFPQRNRIISGLSDVVIITEAKEKSGSLITGDIAIEQGKDVYCVPGRVGDALSFGTNNLIRQGAGIITSIEQLLEDMNLTYSGGRKAKNHFAELSKDEAALYKVLDDYPKELNVLLTESGLTLMGLFSAISTLGDKGLVRETFKNNYVRC